MTARQPPLPDGLNRSGNGKGMKLVTKPVTRKRGASAEPQALKAASRAVRVYTNTSTYAGAESVDPDKPLTEKQRLFVKHWAAGESIISASARAGYGDGATYAYRMIRMPNILRLYEEEKRAYEAASSMTRKRVMDGLLEAVEMAKLMAEPASMVAGWREIAKMCGYYEPVQKKIDINLIGNGRLAQLERLSDAELLRLISTPVEEVVAMEALSED